MTDAELHNGAYPLHLANDDLSHVNNMNTLHDVHKHVSQALLDPAVSSSLKFFLDYSPEIKHESLVCTHISAHLRSRGVRSKREVSLQRRRVDLEIGDARIEAKYHFEGDLLDIKEGLARNDTNLASPWSSANAIASELKRGEASYFMWFVCVRTNSLEYPYKYRPVLDRFYGDPECSSLESGVTHAEHMIDHQLLPLFARIAPALRPLHLPKVEAAHSTLLARLYHFPERDVA